MTSNWEYFLIYFDEAFIGEHWDAVQTAKIFRIVFKVQAMAVVMPPHWSRLQVRVTGVYVCVSSCSRTAVRKSCF